jgi:DNA polymerase-3 subunit beta
MEIRLKRNDFLSELIPMLGIVERKTTIPVLSHILLSTRDDRLLLAATDLDVSLTSRCDAEVSQPGSIAVQAKKLVEIVRSLSTPELLLAQEEPRVLSIRAGGSRFKIHGLAADDFPTLPSLTAATGVRAVDIPFGDFRRMIAKVLFAVSAEESRFQLNGALLKIKDGAVEIAATDGHRLALIEKLQDGLRYVAAPAAGGAAAPADVAADAAAAEDSVLVPRKALQELQRLEGDGMLEFRRGDHNLSFRVGERELICRILEGVFPDYERVIAKDNDKKVVFERKALNDAVQRAALMTSDRARAVRMQFSAEQLIISAVSADLGEAVEEVPCTYDGPDFRVGINPDYLSQFLAAVDTDRVRLELKDENTQCVAYPQEPPPPPAEDGAEPAPTPPAGRYLCVIMPMRI